ncbi:MAG TPA: hypothetical protein VH559_03430 [Gemmatimonadaceae bacterium]|jgi:hypothetical protein
MSNNAQADRHPMQELNSLVRHLADELASFRRRALVAEARVKEVESGEVSAVNADLVARCGELERENERLRSRLDSAGTRAKQMLDRVRFLRQQAQGGDR